MRAAVLGHPVSHSLSPVLHNAAYAALGLTSWHYEAIDCDEDGLAGFLARSQHWAGFSCTMPLKRVALKLAGVADPLAVAVGAANTLLPTADGGWRAAMTDVAGIARAVIESGARPSTATVVGAGATAQACLGALVELGLLEAEVLVRDLSRVGELRGSAERLGVVVRVSVLGRQARALEADLVLSTLPQRASDSIAGFGWQPAQHVLDVVYDPWPTALATAASAAGANVISGAAVLLHQAAAQVPLMTGCDAPVDAMRAALVGAAPGCGV